MYIACVYIAYTGMHRSVAVVVGSPDAVVRGGEGVGARVLVAREEHVQALPHAVRAAEQALDVPAGPAQPGAFAHLIDSYAARVPGAGDRHGLSVVKTVLLQGGEDPQVQIEAHSQQPFDSPDVFIEGPDEVIFGKPQVKLSGDGMRAVLAVRAAKAESL